MEVVDVNLVSEGLKFMVLGMTTVFLFLLLLIWVLKLQAKIVQKFFPENSIKNSALAAGAAAASSTTSTADKDAEVVAAITAAITDYRQK